MPGFFVITPGARIELSGERLRVVLPPSPDGEDERGQEHTVMLLDVEHAIIGERVHITMPALAELMRRQVPVIMTSGGQEVLGICSAPGANGHVKLSQCQRIQDKTFSLAVASSIVEAKIMNSRRVLQRLAANRKEAEILEVLNAMEILARKAVEAQSVETLRGYEGTAAGRYFEIYGGFYPENCPFERRSRQPPHNAPNAVLSYAYTILAAEIECRLLAVGLEPSLGFFHEPCAGRPALALDLLEPFRAPFADALAIDLISHGILKPREHFEEKDGGVFLNSEGKKKFFVAYERRMNRDYVSEQTGQRTTLRNEVMRQAHAIKRTVMDAQPFEPFLMN